MLSKSMYLLVFLLLVATAGLVLLAWQEHGLEQSQNRLARHSFSEGGGVALAQSPTTRTLVLQNGVEIGGKVYQGSEDNYIYQYNPDSNYDQRDILMSGGASNVLLRFDISPVPPDANVSSATLSLYCYAIDGSGTVPGLVNLHRMIRANWTAGDSTWNTYDGINAWTNPGGNGDFDPIVIESWDPLGKCPGWAEYDVTAIIKGYVDLTYNPRAGFFLTSVADYNNTYFRSAEYSDQTLHPKLTVAYASNYPKADAGTDQEVGEQATVTLEGTGSSDDNDSQKALIYRWHILSKPWNSNLTDNSIQPNNTTGHNGADTPKFTVDALGNYDIELTVTNNLGLSSKDIARINSVHGFYVKPEHPRIMAYSRATY